MEFKRPPALTVSKWTVSLHWYKNAYVPFSDVEYFQLMANALSAVTFAGAVTLIEFEPVPKREESHGWPNVAIWKSPQSTMTITMMKPMIASVLETMGAR